MIPIVSRLLDMLPRPLDPLRSVKIKLGILLLAAGAAGMGIFIIGIGWIPYKTAIMATIVALITWFASCSHRPAYAR